MCVNIIKFKINIFSEKFTKYFIGVFIVGGGGVAVGMGVLIILIIIIL